MWRSLRLLLVLLLAASPAVSGHGILVFPPLRGGASGSTLNAYCPQCGNGDGICGDGGQWGSSDFLGYTQGPVTAFSPGDIVEFEVKITAHHRGHFEFSICDQKIDHSMTAAQAQVCLNENRLQRVAPLTDCTTDDTRGDCQPLHTEYPERWYLPPGAGTYKMSFQIPGDLQCSSCTLQWRWWTANSCIPAPDYGCFYSRLANLGWDASSWCGGPCPTCGGAALLQEKSAGTLARCGEEFRNCADIVVLGTGGQETPASAPTPPAATMAPTPAPATVAPTPAPTTASDGECVRNMDCNANAWCGNQNYDAWCAAEGAAGGCPHPECVRAAEQATPAPTASVTTPTPSGSDPTSSPTPAPSGAPDQCVSQSVLACINDYSGYWPKCSPDQAKSNSGPGGYEFGQYCTQEWADALNEVLADPVVGKCSDADAIQKFLAQVAYETGYYSTVYQPIDGGAGLIHMIPGNWAINAADMDDLWPGHDYAGKVASMEEDFFQTAAYGWRSVAAWFKRTNRVIGGCGLDLFGESYDTQTRCILSSVVNREEAYNVVGGCMAAEAVSTQAPVVTTAAPTPSPTTPSATTTPEPVSTAPPTPSPATTGAATTQEPVSTAPPTPSPATTGAATTPGPVSTAAPGEMLVCVPIGDCGSSSHGWCNQDEYTAWCSAGGASGQCPPIWCKQEAQPDPESEPEPSFTTAAPSGSSETSCLPTSPPYSLYCATEGAAGSCPSPYCEIGVALNAERVRTRSRRQGFLGTALIQKDSFVERTTVADDTQQEL